MQPGRCGIHSNRWRGLNLKEYHKGGDKAIRKMIKDQNMAVLPLPTCIKKIFDTCRREHLIKKTVENPSIYNGLWKILTV